MRYLIGGCKLVISLLGAAQLRPVTSARRCHLDAAVGWSTIQLKESHILVVIDPVTAT